MTAIELYIKTLETQLLTMPKDGYVRETVEACRNLAQGIKEIYENHNYDFSQSTNQD